MARTMTPINTHYSLWAYNARSTRPVAHFWPNSTEDYRQALCGAWAYDDLLDANIDNIRECARCKAKREASLK